jgi:hypothetical protein
VVQIQPLPLWGDISEAVSSKFSDTCKLTDLKKLTEDGVKAPLAPAPPSGVARGRRGPGPTHREVQMDSIRRFRSRILLLQFDQGRGGRISGIARSVWPPSTVRC